jgi:hypothetical protein
MDEVFTVRKPEYRRLTDDQRKMTACFRTWLRNPTNADVRERLVNAMVEYEIKVRLGSDRTESGKKRCR